MQMAALFFKASKEFGRATASQKILDFKMQRCL
jgi:hypothetical protein